MKDGRASLTSAQWIVTFMYVVPLVVFPFVPRFVQPDLDMGATTLRMLSAVLLIVGLVDYGVSLFLERLLLAKAQAVVGPAPADRAATSVPSNISPVVTAALVVGGLGTSLAVYGLVLTLLGSRAWGAVLYVLCCLHGFHLLTRWPTYAHAVAGAATSLGNRD